MYLGKESDNVLINNILSEHLIYSIAIGILIYTIYKKGYAFWIIVLSTYAPDTDIIAGSILFMYD